MPNTSSIQYAGLTSTRDYIRFTVGTIKTLDEGVDAWRNMGALAGELAYLANYKSSYAVRKMVREQAQNV